MKHFFHRFTILLLFLLPVLSLHMQAQSGTLDSSFNDDGLAGVYFGPGDSRSQAIAIQNDGKVVIAGFCKNGNYYDFAVARYKADGFLDSTFGGDGLVTTDFSGNDDKAYGITIQPNGKIVVAGYCYHTSYGQKIFALARYNINGTLDNTFSGDGKAFTEFGSGNQMGYSVAIQADKKIVVCGNATFNPTQTITYVAVARFDSIGMLDYSFSSNGLATYSPSGSSYNSYGYDIAIQNSQKIVIGGTITTSTVSRLFVMRLNADGNMDGSFGTSGKTTHAINNISTSGNKLCLQTDQKILVVGGSNNDMAVMRFSQNGAIDSTFDNDGFVLIDFGSASNVGYSIAVAPDGKIVPGGVMNAGSNDYDFAFARLNNDGSLDTSFGNNGKSTLAFSFSNDWLSDLAIQNDGKIVATGYYGSTVGDFRSVRILACNNIIVTRNASDCLQYYWDETKQYLSTSGVYYSYHKSAAGCDSVIKLNLTIYQNPNVNVTRNGFTLTAVQGGGSYQWLDCNKNNDPIPGAINQSYTATSNGRYRVEVTKDGCTDYSNCESISNVGINEFQTGQISILPNPCADYVTIKSQLILNEISVTDLLGKEIISINNMMCNNYRLDLSKIECGIYIISVFNQQGGKYVKKFSRN